MKTTDKHIIVFYHRADMDGIGSAAIAYTVLGENAEYVGVQYDEPLEYDIKGKVVYVFDFSYPLATINCIKDNANKFIWLDHHETSRNMYGANPATLDFVQDSLSEDLYIRLNTSASAAGLVYDYFYNSPWPPLVAAIDDRDRWQFKINKTAEYNAWLYFEYRDFKNLATIILTRESDTLTKAYLIGRTLVAQLDDLVKGQVSSAKEVNDNKHRYWLVPCSVGAIKSELGNVLAKTPFKDGTMPDFVKILSLDLKKDRMGISMRSAKEGKNVNVAEIAEQFGGGGHRNAAGYSKPWTGHPYEYI